jgi:hypothetical protein
MASAPPADRRHLLDRFREEADTPLPFAGEVPERLKGLVSKTSVGLVLTVGSNPTLSASRASRDQHRGSRCFAERPLASERGPAPPDRGTTSPRDSVATASRFARPRIPPSPLHVRAATNIAARGVSRRDRSWCDRRNSSPESPCDSGEVDRERSERDGGGERTRKAIVARTCDAPITLASTTPPVSVRPLRLASLGTSPGLLRSPGEELAQRATDVQATSIA